MVKLDITVREERMLCTLPDICKWTYSYFHPFIDSEIACAVAWSSDCQLLSASDDRNICRWSSDAEKQGVTALNAFVTCLGWFPSNAKQVCVDGRCLVGTAFALR